MIVVGLGGEPSFNAAETRARGLAKATVLVLPLLPRNGQTVATDAIAARAFSSESLLRCPSTSQA